MFKDGWIIVNEVPTHVSTWGGWIEDEIKTDSILLCITGNPGLPDFYYVFLSTLHSLTNIPVWAVNFAGCEIPSDATLRLPSLTREGRLYDLKGQVDHKEEFIRKWVPPSKGVYLVGHSVGGKIAIELMKRSEVVDPKRLRKAFLLFPTLEWISKTRNGRFVMNYLRHFIPLALCLVYYFSLLPEKIKMFLLRIYFGVRSRSGVDKACMEGALKLLNRKSIRAVLFLAMDEMQSIKDLDIEVLERYGDQVHCYYSKTDGWAPPEHRENLRKLCPGVKSTMVEDHILHAFVLSTPREVALKISDEINNSLFSY